MLKVLLQLRHRRFRRDLSAYLDDVLSQRARRRLEAHLDSCQACRQELTELRVTVAALGSLPMAEVPRSFALAAAPVAVVRPRPTAGRLEFGLRLATATAAFALTLVLIGDLAGLPSGGEKETPAPLAPAAGELSANLQAAPGETPAAMDKALVQTPAAAIGAAPVETPAAEETPPALAAAPVETPAAEETPPPPPIAAAPAEARAADETPPAAVAAPVEAPAPAETPPADETPPGMQAPPVETPEPYGTTEPYGFADVERQAQPTSAGVSEGQPPEEKVTEGAEGEEEIQLYANDAQAAAAEEGEGGGLSQEEAVRWLEIGLSAGVGILVVVWAFARFQRNIGNRP
jgi:anti-sigma factor RsiW